MPFGLKELFEADRDLILFASVVVDEVVGIRERARKEAERNAR